MSSVSKSPGVPNRSTTSSSQNKGNQAGKGLAEASKLVRKELEAATIDISKRKIIIDSIAYSVTDAVALIYKTLDLPTLLIHQQLVEWLEDTWRDQYLDYITVDIDSEEFLEEQIEEWIEVEANYVP